MGDLRLVERQRPAFSAGRFIWLLRKELWTCRHDRRLLLGTLLCVALALASAFARVQAFQEAHQQVLAAASRWQESIREQLQRGAIIQVESLRSVSPLLLFSIGLEPVLPERFFSTKEGLRFGEGRGARNLVDALFGTLDLTFVVAVLFSLLAILLTFDCICGERGAGTLAVLLSYPVSRPGVLLAKILTYLLVLSIGFFLSVLVVLAAALLAEIPVKNLAHWGAYAVLGWLYLAVWASLGVAVSARVRRPAQAALVCILFWVASVFLLPRGISLAANFLHPPERLAQLAQQEDDENGRLRTAYRLQMNQAFATYVLGGAAAPERKKEFEKVRADAARQLDRAREAVSRRIWSQIEQEERSRDMTVKALSVISPTALFQSAVSELAWTGRLQRREFYRAARGYHQKFGRKLAESQEAFFALGEAGETQAAVLNKEIEPLLVRFETPWAPSSEVFSELLLPIFGLGFYAALAFVLGCYNFLELDVRG